MDMCAAHSAQTLQNKIVRPYTSEYVEEYAVGYINYIHVKPGLSDSS